MVENNDILTPTKKNNKFKRFFTNVFGKTAGDIIFNILNYFFFIALFVLCLYPFIYVLIESLKLVNTSGDVPTTYFGFDAYNEVYTDMLEAGIVDPTKVTRSALENAASVASMVLTTESLVADNPEDAANAAAAAAAAAGAGGMY